MKSFVASVTLSLLSLSHAPAKDTSLHHKVKFNPKPVKHSLKPSHQAPAATAPAAAPKFTSVVIDAGHGGHDAGGIPENLLPEKDVALDIAMRLSYALQDAGLKTVLTRQDDTFVTLEDRVVTSNTLPDAIFISIHFNAAPRREARGIETYYGKSSGGTALATRIQRNLIASTQEEDRGTKSADFYVLRKNHDLAVLVECGFLTNPEDVALAKDDDYRQKIADQICAAIVDYRKSLP